MLVDERRLIDARGERKPAHVAEEIGVSRQRLCDWESGRKRIPLSALRAIARIYEKPLEYFFTEKIFA